MYVSEEDAFNAILVIRDVQRRRAKVLGITFFKRYIWQIKYSFQRETTFAFLLRILGF